jgi:hypothetical protein
MRYLKNKVARALQKNSPISNVHIKSVVPIDLEGDDKISIKEEVSTDTSPIIVAQNPLVALGPRTRGKAASSASCISTKSSPKSPKRDIQSNKNIVKNYGRAMITFALSDMSTLYLNKILPSEEGSIKEFRKYLEREKESLNSIRSLREMLLPLEHDTPKTAHFKVVFQRISEVFLKFFSVNWIFNSKINEKNLHLKYRLKFLRRIRNPEHFTYLESFNKKG